MEYKSYKGIFDKKFKKCRSKKDYKRLCKEMIFQFDTIDKIDENQWKIFTTLLGTETYAEGIAMAIKMYLLEQQGLSVDVFSCEDILDEG